MVLAMNESVLVFDRRAVRRRRDRAAAGFGAHDFLVREIGERLVERLEDIQRRFPLALDLGCHTGILREVLAGRGGVEMLVQGDLSPRMARAAAAPGHPAVAADEEFLPFAPDCFDLVVSAASLHWVNDLPGALIQIRQALKPDGLFLGAMLGGETLVELRGALLEAEAEVEGGVSPRVSPFADVADAGGLLQRAGFALPVTDRDRITVTYPNALALMKELSAMGESNAVAERRKAMSRRHTLFRAAEIYRDRHGAPEGPLPATFEVVYLTGWSPHPSQQQPLAPGSARSRLADALETVERKAGDPAQPD